MADLQMKTIRYPGINNLYRFMQPDGTYPDLTAGNIISNDAYNEDTEPYLFRALPYKSKKLEESLVGGTVVWNQILKHPDFSQGITGWSSYNATITAADNGCKITATGSWGNLYTLNAEDPQYVSGHKYLTHIVAKGENGGEYIGVNNNNGLNIKLGDLTTSKAMYSLIFTAANTGTFKYSIVTNTSGNILYVYEVRLIDLTQHFGNATIADAIYAMEIANAGAGVAFMRKYFPKLFDADYDAGTFKSVNPTAHVTRGVNAWDEEWEVGGINIDTGVNNTLVDRIRSKNFIPVIPNATYFFNNGTNNAVVLEYDADKNYLGKYAYENSNQPTETMLPNCHYIKFYMAAAYGTTYNHDICINISDPTINGKYFPYEEHTYPLASTTLRGKFNLVDGKLVAVGDEYHADGEHNVKWAQKVINGTESWVQDASSSVYYAFYTQVNEIKRFYDYKEQFINDKGYYIATGHDAKTTDHGDVVLTAYNGSSYSGQNWLYIFIKIGGTVTNVTTLKAWLQNNPITISYPLATATTEILTPFEQYQVCETGGTEEYITTNGVPVGHNTKYYTDLAQKIADLPFDMSMIAPVEETYTATRNYAVGDYLIVDNTFYKVTSAIANGGAITPNTNVTATTVATELIALR